ncbi:Mannitol-1-phosphate 5-dehydrogenase like protein [Verticillium longisporum]|nr:Mannitol-1-phosphate 5-dehydrogenase like protein [Verticillium longisporum]
MVTKHGINLEEQQAYAEKIIKRIGNPHLEDAVERDVEEDEESKELTKTMSENGPEDVVQKVCGIQASEKIHPMLVEVVRRVQADSEE